MERICVRFVQVVVIVALVLAFFVSGTSYAHEFVKSEEKLLGATLMHKVVACDTVEQIVEQAREVAGAEREQRFPKQIEGCGMMMGNIPAMIVSIGTLIVGDVELTLIRFETASPYGDQYGWLAETRQITSL